MYGEKVLAHRRLYPNGNCGQNNCFICNKKVCPVCNGTGRDPYTNDPNVFCSCCDGYSYSRSHLKLAQESDRKNDRTESYGPPADGKPRTDREARAAKLEEILAERKREEIAIKEEYERLKKLPKPLTKKTVKTWRTLELGTELKTGEDFRRALTAEKYRYVYSPDSPKKGELEKMLDLIKVANRNVTVELVLARGEEFYEIGRTNELCCSINELEGAANDVGLYLCPAEVGPQLSLQGYPDQSYDVCVAMKPLVVEKLFYGMKVQSQTYQKGSILYENAEVGEDGLVHLVPATRGEDTPPETTGLVFNVRQNKESSLIGIESPSWETPGNVFLKCCNWVFLRHKYKELKY